MLYNPNSDHALSIRSPLLPQALHLGYIDHRNPLLLLTFLFTPLSSLLALRVPTRLDLLPPILPSSLPLPATLPSRPLSTLKLFHPSNSLSSLKAFSFSWRKSRSARRATSWFLESSDWSSSIVESSLSILSLDLAISSSSCAFCLSRLSIWDCNSRTVRSMLRVERAVSD